MAGFNINEFRSKIDQYKGLSNTNTFLFVITPSQKLSQNLGLSDNPNLMDIQDLKFFCSSVKLPGMRTDTVAYRPNAFGKPETRPSGLNFGELDGMFFIDSDKKVLSFFHAWMQQIVNYDTSGGQLSQVNDMLPYEIAYREDYVASAEIYFFAPNIPDNYYTYRFDTVFPISVGDMSLSWETTNSIAMLPVAFSFSGLKVSGANTGTVLSNSSRGVGIFERLASLISYGQAIRTLQRPRNIQDAINQYTSVSNIIRSFN